MKINGSYSYRKNDQSIMGVGDVICWCLEQMGEQRGKEESIAGGNRGNAQSQKNKKQPVVRNNNNNTDNKAIEKPMLCAHSTAPIVVPYW